MNEGDLIRVKINAGPWTAGLVCNIEEMEEEVVEEESESDDPVQTVYPLEGETGNVLLYDNSLSKEGYVLFNEATDDRVYLMAKNKPLQLNRRSV